MDVVTSIVSIPPLIIQSFLCPLSALAWSSPEWHQCCRRWFLRESVSYYTRQYVPIQVQCFRSDGTLRRCCECVDSRFVYLRVHTGTTVIFLLSIAMACVVRLLFAILKIHMQVFMMSMMACPKSGFVHTNAWLISNLDSTIITLADWCALLYGPHCYTLQGRLTSQSGTTMSPSKHPLPRYSIVRSLTARVAILVDLLRRLLL